MGTAIDPKITNATTAHHVVRELWIVLLQSPRERLHLSLQTSLAFIQTLDEDVSNFCHQIRKTEKRISFGMHIPLFMSIIPHDKKQSPDNLVHALGVTLGRIKLGVDEEYAGDRMMPFAT